MEVVNWIVAHIDDIIAIYLGLVGVASVIVKLTPQLSDDHALKAVIRFVGKFIALNRK